MPKNKIYLRDIANVLNVSQNTVSLALRGMPGVKESTRSKILETAKGLGYIRSDDANPSTILSVATPNNSTDSYFYSYAQLTIEEELNKHGYRLVVMNFANDNSSNILQIPMVLNQINPKGIIILGEISEEICLELLKSELPLVCIGSYYHNIAINCVIEDNLSGIYSAMGCLYKQGYRTFGFIGDVKNFISFWERWVAFVGFVTEHHLDYNENYCIKDNPITDLCNSEWLAEKFRAMPMLPEVFICASDKIAAVSVKVLHTMGYKIPDDIGIVGYDNSELTGLTFPTLTTVDSFRNLQSLATVNILINKINNQDKSVNKVVIPSKFIEGLSTTDKRRP